MALQESGEMYLETILVLSKTKDTVRSIDVVEYMGFSKPSVSRAVAILKKDGYITVEENGHITLTESGKTVAEKIYSRHNILTDFLIALGVDRETAVEDACKMEHDISDTSFNSIKNFVGNNK